MRIVAMSFDEYTALQQMIGKILRDLALLPNDVKTPQVVFGWEYNRLKTGVNQGEGTNVKKVYLSDTPIGLSVNQWATMVLRELENILLVSERFVIHDPTGEGLGERGFMLPLTRLMRS